MKLNFVLFAAVASLAQGQNATTCDNLSEFGLQLYESPKCKLIKSLYEETNWVEEIDSESLSSVCKASPSCEQQMGAFYPEYEKNGCLLKNTEAINFFSTTGQYEEDYKYLKEMVCAPNCYEVLQNLGSICDFNAPSDLCKAILPCDCLASFISNAEKMAADFTKVVPLPPVDTLKSIADEKQCFFDDGKEPFELQGCCVVGGGTECDPKVRCYDNSLIQLQEDTCNSLGGTYLDQTVTCEDGVGPDPIEEVPKESYGPAYEAEGCCVWGGKWAANTCDPASRCWDNSKIQTSKWSCIGAAGTYLDQKVTCEMGLDNKIPNNPIVTSDGGSEEQGCCVWSAFTFLCPAWTQYESATYDPCQATKAGCDGCYGQWISTSSVSVNAKFGASLLFASIGLAAWIAL